MQLFKNSLTPDQTAAVQRLYEYNETILVAPTGAGKTVIALTAIQELIEAGELSRVVYAAPPKVIARLAEEGEKWAHLRDLNIVPLIGSGEKRNRLCHVSDGHVYAISLQNLASLLEKKDFRFDGIVIDELSTACGKQSAKLKLKRFDHVLWRVGMTATPVSQDFIKLYAMCRIIDRGRALGTNKEKYLKTYFTPDYMGYNWTLSPDADALILERIRPLVHVMADDKASKLPPIRFSTFTFEMPEKTRPFYEEMKTHQANAHVIADNAAVASGKLRQIAAGFSYVRDDDDTAEVVRYDTERLDALDQLLRGIGGDTLVFYEYVIDREHVEIICNKHPNTHCAQIRSMSHGVDGWQHRVNHVVFLQPNWSRDVTEQAYGRVWRQGQERPVTVWTIECEGSLDQVVTARVAGNAKWMEMFRQHLEK